MISAIFGVSKIFDVEPVFNQYRDSDVHCLNADQSQHLSKLSLLSLLGWHIQQLAILTAIDCTSFIIASSPMLDQQEARAITLKFFRSYMELRNVEKRN